MELIYELGQEQKSQHLYEYQFSYLIRIQVALFLCPVFGNILHSTILYHGTMGIILTFIGVFLELRYLRRAVPLGS